jgi:hypothetical protein
MSFFYDMVEWKQTEIPFTRGCSFFECSKQGERITIKYSKNPIQYLAFQLHREDHFLTN